VHVETQLRKQQPNIMNLVQRFNTGAAEINSLIDRKMAPPTARKLPLIDRTSIFTLDVDDPIWDDSYFDDSGLEVPQWMGNDDMRAGIRLQLESARCAEELDRLVVECGNLQQWCRQEWFAVQTALTTYCTWSSVSFLSRSCSATYMF
jgi:hypothetical protein